MDGTQEPRPRYVYELLCGARKERLGYLKHTLALLHVRLLIPTRLAHLV